MFELFGCLSNRSSDEAMREPIVHTRPLSDGEEPSHGMYWRDQVWRTGTRAYLEQLYSEFEAVKRVRIEQLHLRWPEARISELTTRVT